MPIKSILKRVVIILLFALVIKSCYSNSTYGSQEIELTPIETKEVIELYKACHKSGEGCHKLQKKQGVAMLEQKKMMEEQNKRIAELTKDSNSFWSNPIGMFIIGAASGGLAVMLLGK